MTNFTHHSSDHPQINPRVIHTWDFPGMYYLKKKRNVVPPSDVC